MELLGKLLPTLAVAAVLGYCCWSEEEVPAGEAKAARKADLAAGVLFPALTPTPGRDPFLTPGEQGGKTPAVAAKEPVAKQATGTSKEVAGATTHRRTDGLILRATYLRDDRRLALINEKFYAEGQTLPPGKNAEAGLLVARIESDRVLLSGDGVTVELKYRPREEKSGGLAAAPVKPVAPKERP